MSDENQAKTSVVDNSALMEQIATLTNKIAVLEKQGVNANSVDKNVKKSVDKLPESRVERQKLEAQRQKKLEKEKGLFEQAVKFNSEIGGFIESKKRFLPDAVKKSGFLSFYDDRAGDPVLKSTLTKIDMIEHFFRENQRKDIFYSKDASIIDSFLQADENKKKDMLTPAYNVMLRGIEQAEKLEALSISGANNSRNNKEYSFSKGLYQALRSNNKQDISNFFANKL